VDLRLKTELMHTHLHTFTVCGSLCHRFMLCVMHCCPGQPSCHALCCRLGAPQLLNHTSIKIAAVMRQALLMINAQHCAAAAATADASNSSAGLGMRPSGSWPSSLDKEVGGAGAAGGGSVGSTGADAGAVHGGYFCRELVGDMKYMLAFGCPEVSC
jgi:hypothetical protein